jgi:hypothetical protein
MKIFEKYEKLIRNDKESFRMMHRSSHLDSTSLSDGNLVDGLPSARHIPEFSRNFDTSKKNEQSGPPQLSELYLLHERRPRRKVMRITLLFFQKSGGLMGTNPEHAVYLDFLHSK